MTLISQIPLPIEAPTQASEPLQGNQQKSWAQVNLKTSL
jgi:hypothetical protein